MANMDKKETMSIHQLCKKDKEIVKLKKIIANKDKEIFQLKSIIDNIPGDIYWKNKKGKYLGINLTGRESLKRMGLIWEPKEIIGKTDYALHSKPVAYQYRKNDLDIIKNQKEISKEEIVFLSDGEKKIQLSTKKPLLNEKGEAVGIIGNTVDITYLKKIENDLKKAKEEAEAADKAKSEFLANMSHDIRTPLAGLIGMCDIIDKKNTNSLTKLAIENIKASAVSLLELLNNIIEFTKIESGSLPVDNHSFSLLNLINRVISLFKPAAQEKNIEITFYFDKRIPKSLMGDSMRMYRILLNLISNAIKFTKQGSIAISANLVKQKNDTFLIKIIVKDTGIGIPIEKQHTIFSRFSKLNCSYTGIYKGYGLGLSMVKQFVLDLKGKVYVKSKEGEGSLFTCILPFKKSQLALKDETLNIITSEIQNKIVDYKLEEQLSSNKKRKNLPKLLLVEDNLIVQLATKIQLEKLNCFVEVANNGEEALKLFKKNRYDLILMDIGLPDINGCEVSRQIRTLEERNKNTPIVALSAHVDENHKKECLKAGIQQILIKPLDEDKNAELLNTYIRNTQEKTRQKKKSHIIDLKLVKNKLGYSEETARKILGLLMVSLPETKKEIQKTYEQSDYKKLRSLAHKFLGGTKYCGIPALTEEAKRLEEALIKNIEKKALNKVYKNFIDKIESLQSEYKEMINRSRPDDDH